MKQPSEQQGVEVRYSQWCPTRVTAKVDFAIEGSRSRKSANVKDKDKPHGKTLLLLKTSKDTLRTSRSAATGTATERSAPTRTQRHTPAAQTASPRSHSKPPPGQRLRHPYAASGLGQRQPQPLVRGGYWNPYVVSSCSCWVRHEGDLAA